MSVDKARRHESEIARLTGAIEFLARALYLLPSLAAAVALATPVCNLRLPDEDLEAKTLLGMIGEFSDLRSAGGVRPIGVIAFVALLVSFPRFLGGVCYLAPSMTRPPSPAQPWPAAGGSRQRSWLASSTAPRPATGSVPSPTAGSSPPGTRTPTSPPPPTTPRSIIIKVFPTRRGSALPARTTALIENAIRVGVRHPHLHRDPTGAALTGHKAAEAATRAAHVATQVAARSTAAAGVAAAGAAVGDLDHDGDASIITATAHPTDAGTRYELAWSGNARAYTLHDGRLVPVTTDHTLAQ